VTAGHPRMYAVSRDNADDHQRNRARLQAFLAAHGDKVQVLAPATDRDVWRAFVPMGTIPGRPEGTIISAEDLGGLMDKLDEMYPSSSY
jgi:hypothetical protein